MPAIPDTLLYLTFHFTPCYMALETLFEQHFPSKGKSLELLFSGKAQYFDIFFMCVLKTAAEMLDAPTAGQLGLHHYH